MKRLFTIVIVSCLLTTSALGQHRNESGHCYRGFFDLGYVSGVGDYKFDRYEVNTTHGYQINPFFFVGAGLGAHFMASYETPNSTIPLDTRESSVEVPVYANVHINFAKSTIAPFIDAKAGAFVTNNSGRYINASAGLRIAYTDKQGVNISFGYTTEQLEFETFHRFVSSSSMAYTRKPRKRDAEGLSFKIGLEF